METMLQNKKGFMIKVFPTPDELFGVTGIEKRYKTFHGAIKKARSVLKTNSNYKMEKLIIQFKALWAKDFCHISMELTDVQIVEFIQRAIDTPSYTTNESRIIHAVDWASDYLIANGLAYVEE